MSVDFVLIGFTSLILAGLVASCLRPKSDEQGGGGGGGAANRGGQQQRRGGAAGRGTSAATTPRKPLSARALLLHKELGVPYGSAVTISTIGVLLERKGQSFSLVTEAVEVLRLLVEFADVFLITEVGGGQGGEDEAAAKEALRVLEEAGTGFITSTPAPGQPKLATREGIAEHKVLFCSTPIGRQAIVRQIRPQLHVDRDEELLLKLVPHVPRLVRVDASLSAKADSVPYKVLASLQAALPPAPPQQS